MLARARSAIGHKIAYRLGAGGRDPYAATPAVLVDGSNNTHGCDCSGFVAWALGVDRYLPNASVPHMPNGKWLETTTLFNDARSPYGFVAEVPWQSAMMADLLVWPDRAGKQGHVGIVSSVGAYGDASRSSIGPMSVIHCSSGNWRKGDAIAETGVHVFLQNKAIVCRVAWVI